MKADLTGTNLGYTRVFNRRVVLEAIRLHGPISRAEIARLTSLMFQTVSNIVSEYIRHDLVRPVGRSNGGRGQPATMLALNSDAAFTYGLQIDRNQVRGVLVDLAGQVRARSVEWCDTPTPEFALPRLAEMADTLRSDAGIDETLIIGAGVAVPGPLDPVDHTIAALGFPGWEGVRLKEGLQNLLQVPVYPERDAAAAALGERLHGDGRGYGSFFYVDFGIGLGGGMIIDRQPYGGKSGYAGEIGHYLAMPGGRPCACGSRGCLETYVSLGAMFSQAWPDRSDRAPALPRSRTELARWAADENPTLLAWLDGAAEHLLAPIVMLDNVLGVEAVFLGGQMPRQAVSYLIGKLEAALPAYRMRGKRTYPTLLPATSGEDAAALGAAVLPVFRSLAPRPGVLLKQLEAKEKVDEPAIALVP